MHHASRAGDARPLRPQRSRRGGIGWLSRQRRRETPWQAGAGGGPGRFAPGRVHQPHRAAGRARRRGRERGRRGAALRSGTWACRCIPPSTRSRRPRTSSPRPCTQCDAMIWSSPTYQGSVSGSFKNALDWLILLADRDAAVPVQQADRAGLHGRRGAGPADRQRDGLHRPLAARLERPAGDAGAAVVAVVRPGRAADRRGHRRAAARRSAPRSCRAARQFQAEGTCDYADDRQFTADVGPARPKAGQPAP